MDIIGLILAGGRGSRLGGIRKGDLRLGGVPLRQRVAGRLASQCGRILYSVPAGEAAARTEDHLFILPDSPAAPAGPAAGLFTGAEWCLRHAPGALLL